MSDQTAEQPPGHRPRDPSEDRAPHRRARPPRDDAGGVWIVTGVVLALVVYGLVVLMDMAGFTEVLPLVVLPPVVVGLIAANSLLGGGRTRGRAAAPVGPDRMTGAGDGAGTDGRPVAGEPHSPR